MRINIRRSIQISFALYIRKYSQDKFDELATGLDYNYNDMTDEQIQDVVNRMNREDCKVFKIRYHNDIFENIDDFIKDLNKKISEENIYVHLRGVILNSDMSNGEKVHELEGLYQYKDDCDILCLQNNISLYLNQPKDAFIHVDIGNDIQLVIESYDDQEHYIDFMMTADNPNITYSKFYQLDDVGLPLPYSVLYPIELNPADRFEFDTA
ncbi:hypothetical protein M9Y10_010222, partial [Tritrichomonas musculus]